MYFTHNLIVLWFHSSTELLVLLRLWLINALSFIRLFVDSWNGPTNKRYSNKSSNCYTLDLYDSGTSYECRSCYIKTWPEQRPSVVDGPVCLCTGAPVCQLEPPALSWSPHWPRSTWTSLGVLESISLFFGHEQVNINLLRSVNVCYVRSFLFETLFCVILNEGIFIKYLYFKCIF